MPRKSNSVRFDAYYKIQRWEARSFAWKDIQRSYDTMAAAVDAAGAGVRDVDWRIMQIDEDGRRPVPA